MPDRIKMEPKNKCYDYLTPKGALTNEMQGKVNKIS